MLTQIDVLWGIHIGGGCGDDDLLTLCHSEQIPMDYMNFYFILSFFLMVINQ